MSLNRKKFSDVCEFYSSKYNEYKNILIEKQKRYDESFEMVYKVKVLIEKGNKDVEETIPKKSEYDKIINEQRKHLAEKQIEKNSWRTKKQNEDKIIDGLTRQLKDKENQLKAIMLPFEGAINKVCNQMNKTNQNDITEIKNTWDSY